MPVLLKFCGLVATALVGVRHGVWFRGAADCRLKTKACVSQA